MTKDGIDKAPKGALIIWDSHYSFRAKRSENQYNYDYLANQPDKFKLVNQYMAGDESFGILVFEKL
jgi:hypothetical protein